MGAEAKFATIDDYLQTVGSEGRARLEAIRQLVTEEVPGVTEAVSYGIPTFRLAGKNFLHMAAYKKHVGLYGASTMAPLAAELERYRTGKGTLQFPLSDPLPLELIRRIVSLRAGEHEAHR